jgi:hypothetical protein
MQARFYAAMSHTYSWRLHYLYVDYEVFRVQHTVGSKHRSFHTSLHPRNHSLSKDYHYLIGPIILISSTQHSFFSSIMH